MREDREEFVGEEQDKAEGRDRPEVGDRQGWEDPGRDEGRR